MDRPQLPYDVKHARTTDTFDNDTVPAGLLKAHRVGNGTWGRLVVHTGTLTFVFDDAPDQPVVVTAGNSVVIPPVRQHHIELDAPATFAVEFYRACSAPTLDIGMENSAFDPNP